MNCIHSGFIGVCTRNTFAAKGDFKVMHLSITNAASERGTATWFTGEVWLDELATPPKPSALRVHRVSFLPGARTHWHAHPVGQVLHGVAGLGLVVSRSGGPRLLGPGDTVWIEPDEVHWHGSAGNQLFVHIAVKEAALDGLEANWSSPVTQAEYASARGGAK